MTSKAKPNLDARRHDVQMGELIGELKSDSPSSVNIEDKIPDVLARRNLNPPSDSDSDEGESDQGVSCRSWWFDPLERLDGKIWLPFQACYLLVTGIFIGAHVLIYFEHIDINSKFETILLCIFVATYVVDLVAAIVGYQWDLNHNRFHYARHHIIPIIMATIWVFMKDRAAVLKENQWIIATVLLLLCGFCEHTMVIALTMGMTRETRIKVTHAKALGTVLLHISVNIVAVPGIFNEAMRQEAIVYKITGWLLAILYTIQETSTIFLLCQWIIKYWVWIAFREPPRR